VARGSSCWAFALGATAARLGSLAPFAASLQAPAITIGGAPPTLATMLGVSPWLVILVLAIAGAIWMARAPGEPQHRKWPWPSPALARVSSSRPAGGPRASAGLPVGLTFAVNTGELLTYPLVGFPNRVNWSMVMLIGVPVGAFIAAWGSGEFQLEAAAKLEPRQDLLGRAFSWVPPPSWPKAATSRRD